VKTLSDDKKTREVVIAANDVLEELSEENKRLFNELLFANKCLKLFTEFKAFLDCLISNKIDDNFDENQCKIYRELNVKMTKIINDFRYMKNMSDFRYISREVDIEVIDRESEDNCLTKELKSNSKSIEIQSQSHIKTKPELQSKAKVESLAKKSNPISKSTESVIKKGFSVKTSLITESSNACGKQLKSESNANAKYVCPYPGCHFKTHANIRLRDHQNFHTGDRPHKCPYCDKTYASGKYMKRHMKTLHELWDQPMVCDIDGCNKTYRNGIAFNIHQKVKHFTEKRFVCEHPNCGFRAISRSVLRAHMISHSDEKPFHCSANGCQRTFKYETTLAKHVRLAHDQNDQVKNQKKYLCDQPNCQFSCRQLCILKSHQSVHSTDRPFRCTVDGCDKAFKTRSTVKSHMKTHTIERNFRCTHEDCHKTYKTNNDLIGHIIRYHREKKLSCDWPGCDYKTNELSHLKNHMTVHTNERNFACDWNGCEKRFKTKNRLNCHLKIHRGDKRHACHWPGCGYRSVSAHNLRDHILTHSVTESNYVCDWPECGKRYKTEKILKVHQRVHTRRAI
jgi:uncharacterized Zn-finger protein